jgi:hypothetical protein
VAAAVLWALTDNPGTAILAGLAIAAATQSRYATKRSNNNRATQDVDPLSLAGPRCGTSGDRLLLCSLECHTPPCCSRWPQGQPEREHQCAWTARPLPHARSHTPYRYVREEYAGGSGPLWFYEAIGKVTIEVKREVPRPRRQQIRSVLERYVRGVDSDESP